MSAAVTAIVVSFRSRADLPACLDALAAQEGVALETWVVDNASDDGSAALAAARPGVHVVANRANVGFARANNQVLERVATPFVALVNPDAVPAPGAIAACVDALVATPRLAMASCRLVDAAGRTQPSCHSFPGFVNLLGEALALDRLFPGSKLAALHLVGFDHLAARRVDWVQGAFLVVRTEAIRQVGVFDPAFFMYGEEMDWCRRFADAGWGVLFLPAPTVVHEGGASSRPLAGPMFAELQKSRVRWLRKHLGALEATACTALIAVALLGRWAVWEALAAVGGLGRIDRARLDLRRRMFRGAGRWVLSGCPLGPPLFAGLRPAGAEGRDVA